MAEPPTLLKALLTERHMQSHTAFCREYEKAARRIDASLAGTAPGREQYQRWLSGRVKTKPHPGHCRVLERMFPGRTVTELFEPCYVPDEGDMTLQEEATNRRELFQIGGAAIAGLLLDRLWSEASRMQETLDTTTIGSARLATLQEEAADLGVRVVRVPPVTLIQETLMRFREVRKLTEKKQALTTQRELIRCATMLATVMGEILFNEGQFPLARHWYSVARSAALEARDQYLAAIVLAGSTYLPTYTPDPRAVLDTVDPRLEVKHAPSPPIAWLWGFKAKAHAMLGERDAFEGAITQAHRALDASSPGLIRPGIFSFMPEKLAFYEARGQVELGNTERASEAADRALSLYDPSETTEPALVRFEQASAYVQVGEIREGCRLAASAVLDRHTYHSVSVVTRAKEFDRLVGASNCEAARDWRGVLESVRPPQLALTAGSQEPI